MALTKVTSGLISADASSVDLNIDAGTLYIDATNNRVGIGTSSPSDVLHVVKTSGGLNARIESADSNAAGHLYQNITTGTTTGDGLFVGIGSGEQGYMYHYESQPLIFGTGGTEKMRIDSSGNVGIGETTVDSKLEIKQGSGNWYEGIRINNSGNTTQFGTFSNNSGATFIGAADTAGGNNNAILFGNSTNGTTFTERMRIDSVGSAKFQGGIRLEDGVGTGAAWITKAKTILGGSDNDLVLYTESGLSQRFYTQGTERMRIDSSGNVGIGKTPNRSRKLEVAGNINLDNGGSLEWEDGGVGIAGSGATDVMTFATAGTERMRLDSAGNLLIGKTSSGVTNNGFEIPQNSNSGVTSSNNNSGNNTYHVYNTGDGAYKFYVSFGGTINAVNTSISGLSDERLKENIVDLETGLTEVMALKPRRFDWKDGSSKNIAGFIAQEVETVLPDLIDGYKHDTIKDAKSLKMGDMLPTLVKAIQEQQVLIEQLQAEVALLKGE